MGQETEEIKDIVRIIASEVDMAGQATVNGVEDTKNYRFWGFDVDVPIGSGWPIQLDVLIEHSHDQAIWATVEEIQYTDSGQELSKTYRKQRRYYRITVTNNSGATIDDVSISTRKGN